MRQERKAEIKAAVIKELKSLIGPLVILAIILAGVATILLWPEKVEEEEIIQMRGYDGEKQEFVMENDKFLFTLDSETTQFNIMVKETGEVWYSNPAEEKITADVLSVAQIALDSFIAMRETEGEKMKADILSRANTILSIVGEIEERQNKLATDMHNV